VISPPIIWNAETFPGRKARKAKSAGTTADAVRDVNFRNIDRSGKKEISGTDMSVKR
jgi:hypothetical protein